MDNEKLKKIIKVLVIILIIICIAFAGLYAFRKLTGGNSKTELIPIQHDVEKEDKVELDEEDVKKWLDNHKLIDLYFVENENNFDLNNADNKFYSNFLGFNLMFGGLSQNAVENITLNNEKYNYQYTYPISFIKNILNDYFGVGIDKIDINIMNESFKDLANFSMDSNMFTIKVVATGLDNYNSSELNKISLNNDNNIVINYNLKQCLEPDESCKLTGQREIVLKKTANGYNILKAYKVAG